MRNEKSERPGSLISQQRIAYFFYYRIQAYQTIFSGLARFQFYHPVLQAVLFHCDAQPYFQNYLSESLSNSDIFSRQSSGMAIGWRLR